MKKRIILYALATLLLLPSIVFARETDKTKNSRKKSLITAGEIHANNVKGVIANNGWLFWGGGDSGFITPSPVFKDNDGNYATIYASGLWLVGTVNGEKRAAIANYVTDFIPGLWDEYKDDPNANGTLNTDYIVYYKYSDSHILYLQGLLEQEDQTATQKVHKYANAELEKASQYNALWDLKAVPQGALANPPGDVVAFTVYHDADNAHRQDNRLNDTKEPMNIQVRMTAFAFRSSDAINNAVFVKMEFVNKNTVPITNVYATVWSDPDVGDATDDLVGSDRDLGLGFAYNGGPVDASYTTILGLSPPAAGYDYFQGPIVDQVGSSIYARSTTEHDLTVYINNDANYEANPNTTDVLIMDKYVNPATGFFYFDNGEEAINAVEYYNFAVNRFAQTGALSLAQSEYLDANPGTDTSVVDWMFFGDPAERTGWLDENPNDRRFILNNGPFELGVSDGTETFGDPGFNETVFGVFSSFGSNNNTSVSVLKFEDRIIQNAFNNAFVIRPAPPAPIVSAYPSDRGVYLTWKAGKKLIVNGTKTITTEKYDVDGYTFEGYEVVQFPSAAASNTSDFNKLASYDLINNIIGIEQIAVDPNTGGLGNFVVAKGLNTGISRNHTITRDSYKSDSRLLNNNFYAFGVRAYYYNPNPNDGSTFGIFSEWATGLSQVAPRNIEIGTVLASEAASAVEVSYVNSGGSDGKALVSVVDPYITTNAAYAVKFEETTAPTYYRGYPNDTIPTGTLVWYLEKNGVRIDLEVDGIMTSKWIKPQSVSADEYNYDLFVDGLRLIVTGPPADFKNFTVVANGQGALDPFEMGAFAFNNNGFPKYNDSDRPSSARQQVNGSTWGIHMADAWMTDHEDASYHYFVDDVGYYMGGIGGPLAPALPGGTGIHHAIPNDYEIRFTAAGGKALMRNNSGAQTRVMIDVPFELWNTGPVPSDTSDDYRMAPFIYDRDNNNMWNMRQIDHPVSGGDNDPQMEGITFLDPTDKTPGQAGYDALIAAATADAAASWATSVTSFPYAYNSTFHNPGFNFLALVNWNGGSVSDATYPANIDATVPEEGTIFRISMGKINTAGTVFNFDGPGVSDIANPSIALKNFEKDVNVFPNPYYGYHPQQNAKDGSFITFNNLPAVSGNDEVNVSIYSLGGQKVKSLKYKNNGSTILKWYLTNDAEIKVASGVYIAVLKYKSKTVIKKLLIFQGEQRLKTF
jgi:hypothetical protein